MATETIAPAPAEMRSVRAQVSIFAHKQLRKKQRTIEETTEQRPQIVDVVALVLEEWAASQPKE